MFQALLAALALAAPAKGTVQTDSLWSSALGVTKHYVVYLPPSYATATAQRYPVAYYLHGYSGSETDWTRFGHLAQAMDSLIAAGAPEMIVVMPDGDNSWYTTWNTMGDNAQCRRDTTRKEPAATFCVPWPHYDDYIARDLVHHVDSVYRTEADRAHRAIAGLSMGGYGAIELALQYPDVWSAAASHSGTVQFLYAGPHPFAGKGVYASSMDQLQHRDADYWPSLEKAFGRDLAGWRARDPLTRLERLRAERPAMVPVMYLDVGRDDPFVDQNRAFAHGLDSLAVTHVYAEYAGGHSWTYWSAHVGQSLGWIERQIAGGR